MNRKCSSPILLLNGAFLLLNGLLLMYPDQVAPPSGEVKQSSQAEPSGVLVIDLSDKPGRPPPTTPSTTEATSPRQGPWFMARRVTSSADDYIKANAGIVPLGIIKPDYDKLRRDYMIPEIQHTKLVNCAAILNNSSSEVAKAQEVMKTKPKVPIYEETYMEWVQDCDSFKRRRGYIEVPLTKEEEEYPLAFSISMYRDVELAERLLRAIYHPQNVYCIHIDTKTSLLIHRTMHAIANCFDNVFIASRVDKVKWGDVSVLLPALNCMRDLVKYHWGKWRYYMNLAGQEFPLRTNYELVQIAKIFNGSNDIAGSAARMEMDRVDHYWLHRWSKTYQQTIFYDTMKPKPRPPFSFNLTFYKGELHGFFSRNMVRYIVVNETAKKYLEWCWDTGHPSEHYWNVLNNNVHLKAPGGYEGPQDLADEYSYHPSMRAKHWQDQNYIPRECQGQIVRGICVYGVGDVPWLGERKEMFANKFYLTYQYLALDCMEERHRNRTKMGKNVPFPRAYYQGLPTVLYGRKDGLI